MATAKPQEWTYQGRYDSLDIKLPSGRWVTIKRGESVPLLPNEAKTVSKLPGWTRTSKELT